MQNDQKKGRAEVAPSNPAKNSNWRYFGYYITSCVKSKRMLKGGSDE